MWGNLLLGNPFHMSHSTSYLLYLQQQNKKKTKTTHLGTPSSKNILSEYSFLNTRLVPTKNNKKKGQEEENRSEPLISCVSFSLLVACLA